MKPYIAAKLTAEAARNIYRNPSVSIAGMILSLIAFFSFGTAVSVYYNIGRNIRNMQDLPELEAFMYPEAPEEDRDALYAKLMKTPGVLETDHISKDEAFEIAKSEVGEDSEVLDILGKDFLPESFVINIDNSYNYEEVISLISSYDEVESIKYSGNDLEYINRVSGLSKSLSWIIFAGSLFFAFVTISSLIRITVYTRKKEITVKKYMGAGSLFIMLPFVLEGVIISFIGAAVSWLIFLMAYSNLAEMYSSYMYRLLVNSFEIVPVNDFKYVLLMFVLTASIIFGTASGLYAVRRHLI